MIAMSIHLWEIMAILHHLISLVNRLNCQPIAPLNTTRISKKQQYKGEMRKLYKTYDKSVRLYAFGVDKTPYSFFCVAVSLEDIILLDVRYTGKVMAQWKHNMDDAPPTHVEIITANGKTHIFAWDLLSHRVFTISFDYNGSLASGPGIYPMAKKISLATSQSIIFQKQEFKYLGGKSFIHMAGVATVLRSMPCSVLGSRPICAFFRLMKDGRLTYQLSLMSPWESAVPDATGLPCFITNDSLIKFMSSKIEKERIEERAKDTKKDDQVSMAKCILNESLSKILKPHTPERRITSNQIEGVLEDEKRISYPSTLAELIYRQGSGQPNRQQFIELYSSLQDNSETQTHWIPSSKEGGPIPFAGGDFLEDVLDGIDKNDVPPTISHLDQTCYATRVSTRQVLNTGLAETIAGNRIISIPVNRDTLATTPTLRFLALGNPLTNVTNSVKLLASEWTPGLSKSAHITVRNQYSRDQAKVVKPSDIFPIPVRAEKRKRGVDFEDIDAGFMFEESTQIIEVLGTSKNKKPIMSLTQPSSTTETMVSKLPATSSQPIPGAFSERKISAPKKKKKKVQGFK
ncbi:hypothetical protein CLU79DRAFT_491883 [Phycomyces nitens]|nr:hypothetical protein CLU79DRAFT_491883 [Phycomyces nitens]